MVFYEYFSYEMYFFFADMSVLMAVDHDVFLPQLLTTEPFLLFGCAAMALFYPWAFSGGGDETLVVVSWFNVIFL